MSTPFFLLLKELMTEMCVDRTGGTELALYVWRETIS